jgi:rhodanese-related sulfurtransferase
MAFLTSLRNKLFGIPIDYNKLIQNGAIIIDARTPREFKSGHATKSRNFPLNVLNSRIADFKGKTVILVCKSGGRAGMAKALLHKEGVIAHNLGPWQRAQNL